MAAKRVPLSNSHGNRYTEADRERTYQLWRTGADTPSPSPLCPVGWGKTLVGGCVSDWSCDSGSPSPRRFPRLRNMAASGEAITLTVVDSVGHHKSA
jgi:hypothetical protein